MLHIHFLQQWFGLSGAATSAKEHDITQVHAYQHGEQDIVFTGPATAASAMAKWFLHRSKPWTGKWP
jgi:hypothetical protein